MTVLQQVNCPFQAGAACPLLRTLVFWLKLWHQVQGKNELDLNFDLYIYICMLYFPLWNSARLGFTGCEMEELMRRLDQRQESDAIQTATLQES